MSMSNSNRAYGNRYRRNKHQSDITEGIIHTEYMWSHCKSAAFLVTFLKKFKGGIFNEDLFDVLCTHISKAGFLQIFRNVFPAAERNKLRSVLDKKFSVTWDGDDSCQTIMRDIWRVNAFRKKLIVLAEELYNVMQNNLDSNDENREASRWQELVETMHLTELEADILWVTRAYGSLDHLIVCDENSRHTNGDDSKIKFISNCLDVNTSMVREAVSENSKLRRYHFVDEDIDYVYRVENFLNGLSQEPLNSTFFKKDKAPALPWNFYENMAVEHGSLLKKLLTCNRQVNILFYGTPGTGKTSFARTLSRELNMDCFFIAQNSSGERRSDSSRDFRFGALQICDQQINGNPAIIVVDEADEMLCNFSDIFGFSTGGNKGQLNSVLDNLKTPTIWITNSPAEALDESSRRRFDYSIEFKPLDSRQRLTIWQNNIKSLKLQKYFSQSMLEELAVSYPVSAGGISLSLENIKSLKPKVKDVPQLIKKLLSVHCQLLNINSTANEKLLPAQDYSLDGLNIKGDIALDSIVSAVRKFQLSDAALSPDRPRMNLLLAGPPGTGKTEYVKYLGMKLNTKVLVRMGSDLLSKWVGGTEQNIKAAFEQAEREKAILFLDEIDGLVQSREKAGHSWEVTQVNELLYQMENFNGIMIGATNFLATLDPAIMRRFTFKLSFDYLDNAGKRCFFERMFNTMLTDEELRRLDNIAQLTPGDFRTVRQGLYYLDEQSNSHRLSALEEESASKKQNRGNIMRIGF